MTRQGLPLVLDVTTRRCVVVGAGAGGRRKLTALLAAGAKVTVIDPAISALDGDDTSAVTPIRRAWRHGDLADADLVVIATDDQAVNTAAAAEANAVGALVLRADRSDEGDVWLPAVTRRESLTIAVDSGGASPAVAAVARAELTRILDEEGDRWDELVRWATRNRPVSVAEAEAKLSEMRGRS
ncbi:MAG: NAD(P)-dependent oxidoreductase [Actinomycetota bacterium]